MADNLRKERDNENDRVAFYNDPYNISIATAGDGTPTALDQQGGH